MAGSAIGLIETRGMAGVVEAADAAAKAANVELLQFERIGGGLVSIRFSGDVASVQTAVRAGADVARRVTEVISSHVIPGPHADVVRLLQDTIDSNSGASRLDPLANQHPTLDTLKNMPVARLRQLVRQTPGAGLTGRNVSRANKKELIEELQRLWQEE